MTWLFFGTGCLSALALLWGCCAFSGPRHRGPATRSFDGRRFHNEHPSKHGSFRRFLKWRFEREPAPWREVEATPGPRPPQRVDGGRMRVTFVNHATALVQADGLNVLTDPIWSERSSPVSWAGPRRIRPPGIRFEDLPPIDVVLVSHNHYDHMDLPTLKMLASTHRPRIFVGLGNRAFLEEEGIPGVAEVDWDEEVSLARGVRLVSVAVRHFSGRGLCDRDRTLWTGYVLRGPSGTTYFPGDTGFGPHFAETAERHGPIRLALLPIGAFLPRWFMSSVHISPEEALRAHVALRASTSVAIHFGTFPLGDDGPEEAPRQLLEALDKGPVPRPRFWVLGFGEGRDVPAVGEEGG